MKERQRLQDKYEGQTCPYCGVLPGKPHKGKCERRKMEKFFDPSQQEMFSWHTLRGTP